MQSGRQPPEPEAYTTKLITQFLIIFQLVLDWCSSMKTTVRLKPRAKFVFRPNRPVPYVALSKVNEELGRLQPQEVITPVSDSSWTAPTVAIKKTNGTTRICADFSTGHNAVLEQHHYPLPTPSDLLIMLNGEKFFVKLDLNYAYLQMEVDEESRELLATNAHHGLFQYNRLPFRVKTAPSRYSWDEG